MSKLYIIATNHFDTANGPKKLRKLYSKLNPEVLMSEVEEAGLRDLNRDLEIIREKLKKDGVCYKEIEKLFEVVRFNLSFEFSVNEVYATEHSIPNYRIDMPGQGDRFSESKLTFYGQLLGPSPFDIRRSIKILEKRSAPSELIEREWDRTLNAEKYVFFESLHLGAVRRLDVDFEARTKYMAAKIRGHLDHSKVTAVTVGMWHTLDAKLFPTLYTEIKDLNPVRIPLLESAIEEYDP